MSKKKDYLAIAEDIIAGRNLHPNRGDVEVILGKLGFKNVTKKLRRDLGNHGDLNSHLDFYEHDRKGEGSGFSIKKEVEVKGDHLRHVKDALKWIKADHPDLWARLDPQHAQGEGTQGQGWQDRLTGAPTDPSHQLI